jgi:hypothetical protein
MTHLPNLPTAMPEIVSEDQSETKQVEDGVVQEIQRYLNYLESFPPHILKLATFPP